MSIKAPPLFSPPCTSRQQVSRLVESWHRQGLRVGFTSGVFDLLHVGHVEYLAASRRLVDRLIVGVNSDDSVRKNKGPKRPLVPQEKRLRVVSALRSVDAAFIFDEANNRANLLALRPSHYLKAADYAPPQLTSAPLLKGWGGVVKRVAFQEGNSTTALIEEIIKRYHPPLTPVSPVTLPLPTREARKRKAIFLDRDGVINEEVEYLHEVAKFRLLPRVAEALQRFMQLGFRLVVITNQAGIGLGYFTKEAFFLVNKKMLSLLSPSGVVFDRVYYCPHSKAEQCECQKPKLGLVKRAVEELDLVLPECYFIGDKTSDLETGRRAGMKTILVETGHGGRDEEFSKAADHTAKDLGEAAAYVASVLISSGVVK